MRCTGNYLLNAAFDLAKFVHQVSLVVQATSCINQYNFGTTGNCTLHRIESNCGGIGTHGLFYNRNSCTVAPDGYLVYSSSTESVCCAKQNLLACFFKI